jgi:hypothetical protein
VTLKTARLTIDRSLLPQRTSNLGIRFERHSVTTMKPANPPADMVLMKPAGTLLSAAETVGPEPRWNNILCGMHLITLDGSNVQGRGQLIITGQRFIGMIDEGTAVGGPPLSVTKSGSIFCFTFHRDDVYPAQVKKRVLQPSDFSFRSREEQPVAFQLMVIMAMVCVANDKMGYWHDKNMLHSLSEEGRQGLLRS